MATFPDLAAICLSMYERQGALSWDFFASMQEVIFEMFGISEAQSR